MLMVSVMDLQDALCHYWCQIHMHKSHAWSYYHSHSNFNGHLYACWGRYL